MVVFLHLCSIFRHFIIANIFEALPTDITNEYKTNNSSNFVPVNSL